MKLWIDTANIDEIRTANDWGVIDGVTTNPTLVAKAGHKDFKKAIQEICSIVDPWPVSAETVTTTAAELIPEGRELASWAPNVVVKVPLIPEGLKAVKVLSAEGIKTNVTLCFTPAQAILAAKAGATYVSPFVGRLEDRNEDGMRVVEDIVAIYRNYNIATEVITASVRDTLHITRAALAGAHIATVPFAVIEKMYDHPLTEIGLKSFLADWAKLQAQ
ncbi:MAG: fructose-6-phosphate aldolase [Candidatus Zipacnadales bacterium]